MPTPKDIFQHPQAHWAFLTVPDDSVFEGQYFDRKEAGRRGTSGFVDKNQIDRLVDNVTECVSAFANSNPDGGLLVLGIAKDGRVTGFSHLREDQRNRVTNTRAVLVNHSAHVSFHPCHNVDGQADEICLIYVPYAEHGLCETIELHPKAWLRQGAQNILMSDAHRQVIRRDKRIVDFERTYACPYNAELLDGAVLTEFRRGHLADATLDHTDEELLYQIGALEKDDSGRYTFTNAGVLFFCANPQRVLPYAYIRLLRYAGSLAQEPPSGLPTLERNFTGPLSKQIRDIRTFFQESGSSRRTSAATRRVVSLRSLSTRSLLSMRQSSTPWRIATTPWASRSNASPTKTDSSCRTPVGCSSAKEGCLQRSRWTR